MWAPIRRQLASRYQLIMYDMQGTGRSTPSALPITRETLTDEIDALLVHLGLERVLALGYSFGTSVLINYAASRPERIQALSLVSGVYNVTPSVRCYFDVQTELAAVLTRSQYLRQVLLWLFSDAFLNENPEFFERMSYMMAQSTFASRPFHGWRQFMGAFESDYRAKIAALASPLQIVHGEADKVSPVNPVRELASARPGCRLDVVPEGGHMLTWDSSEATVAAILDFLGAHGASVAGDVPRPAHSAWSPCK